MKRNSTIFLQIVILILGISALIFMLWEPHLEGRNVNATLFEIYFKDAFLAYAYIASIPFFVALWEASKVLGYVRENKTFSPLTAKALRTIKYCMTTLVAFVVGAEAYLFIFQRGKDDIAGGVFIGLIMIAVFGIMASTAGVFEKISQNAMSTKSKNSLAA